MFTHVPHVDRHHNSFHSGLNFKIFPGWFKCRQTFTPLCHLLFGQSQPQLLVFPFAFSLMLLKLQIK